MGRRHPFPILFVLPFILVDCGTPEADPPTPAEQAREIAGVFESPQVYTVRTLDSLDIERFLAAHPEFRTDSTELRGFYQRRHYQYAWFLNDTLAQAASGFLSMMGGADTAFCAMARMRDRVEALLMDTRDTVAVEPCDRCRLDLELALTAQFFRFADSKYGGLVATDLHELDWYIPRRKKNVQRLLDSLVAGTMDLSLVEPLHPQYALLKGELKRYHELDTLPDWPALDIGELRKLEPGQKHPSIPDIRRRLVLLGDLQEPDDSLQASSPLYDSTLVTAVRRFQERHGLNPDGVIGLGFLSAVNITPRERVRTMLVNMERLRWVPETNAPDLILVNIPEFRLHVHEAGEVVLSMDVVVGAVISRTVVFSDTLSTIVFSPSWTIPESITRGEILPAMRKDPGYLEKKGMTIVGGSASLPVIRQRPGANNSLGRVKFLFPNDYRIYMHDTPAKSLFARDRRAFSHGCIRLSRPADLAAYLLRNDSTWTGERIREAMHSGKEKHVRLKEKRPVTIGYFTAWVDGQGRLNFREDVYGHDDRLANELFFEELPLQASAR